MTRVISTRGWISLLAFIRFQYLFLKSNLKYINKNILIQIIEVLPLSVSVASKIVDFISIDNTLTTRSWGGSITFFWLMFPYFFINVVTIHIIDNCCFITSTKENKLIHALDYWMSCAWSKLNSLSNLLFPFVVGTQF